MGGPDNYPRVYLPYGYHELITQEFYQYVKRGQGHLNPSRSYIEGVTRKVYTKYPISGVARCG
jgi:hypothetical protein